MILLVLLHWSWRNGPLLSPGANLTVQANQPPLHWQTHDGPGLWGMAVTLVADGALYLSLLFGWFYLGIVTPVAGPTTVKVGAGWLLGSALLLTVGTLYLGGLLRRLRRGSEARLGIHFLLLTLLGLLQVTLLLGALQAAELQPRARALDAVVLVMLLYSLIHCALATILTALQDWRARLGYVSARQSYEPRVVAQLWLYNLGVLWISYLAIVLFPLGWGNGS